MEQASWCERLLAPVITNWPLLLVAIWGIWVTQRTLKVIARQAVSMRRQTTILRRSLEATIASERAGVMVDIEPVPGVGFVSDGSSRDASGTRRYCTNAFIRCICSNQGKTPAKIIEKRCRLLVLPPNTSLPRDPNLDIEIVDPVPHYLHSNEPTKHDWAITGDGEWGDSTVIIYGVVKYRHLFSEHEVQTTFGYKVAVAGVLERLILYPEYNKNT